jgi:tRNA(Leu) C34 or U34 (ribose-2'-O)-methylase TrmL
MSVILGIDNPSYAMSIGSLWRVCYNFDIKEFFTIGKRYEDYNLGRELCICIPLKVADNVRLQNYDTFFDVKDKYKDYTFIASLFPLDEPDIYTSKHKLIKLSDYEHPENAVYMFGPERGKFEVLESFDDIITIPIGNRCFNIATAAAILLYDRWLKKRDKNE